MNKPFKCFICSLQITEISTLKSHIRIIHNIKDGPYLKLKCCNNQNPCDLFFLSYSAFSRHMLNCINVSSKSTISNDSFNLNFDLAKLNSNYNVKNLNSSVTDCLNDGNKKKNIFDNHLKNNKFNSNNDSPHLNVSNISIDKNSNNPNYASAENLITQNSINLTVQPKLENNHTESLLSNIVQLNLPESTTNNIFTHFTSYINSTADDLLSFVLSSKDLNDPQQYKSLVDKVNDLKTPFASISTSYLRKKKLTSAPGFVMPRRIVVSKELKPVLHFSRLYVKKPKQICFAYVPILKTLELVLRHEEVQSYLSMTDSNESDVYKTPSDGSAVKNCEFYKRFPKALKIILYFDEYETVNPLGSKTGKHKLGALYMTLANLPYHINSKLKSIFLVAKFNCKDLKNGKVSFDDILKPVLEDVKILEEGVHLNNDLHHGSILTISADNLGGNSIFGFVECFNASHYCRYCTADIGKCRKMIKEDASLIRNVEQYKKSYLQYKNESAKNKKICHKFGVKHICLLIKLNYYSLFNNMTFDGMHDILEGVLQYDIKFVGKYLISQKILTLDQINERIESFDYGPINQSNKPSAFKVTKKGHLINQRAGQAWCLLSVFPIMFADVITTVHKPKFKLITTLIEIAKIVFSPVISKSMVNSLRTLIEVHHRIVLNHFQITIPPKFHFLIHYPSMIERMGPPVYYWCMRFEGKHNFFVDLVNKLKNYKNICMTLTFRHQIISHQFWGDNKSKLNSFSFGKQKFLVVPSSLKIYLKKYEAIPNEIKTFSFFTFNSIKFAPSYFLIDKVVKTIPTFNEILYVFEQENEMKFVTKIWETYKYDSALSAYEIKATNVYKIIYFKNLKYFETFNKLQNYRRTNWYIVTKTCFI